MKKFIVSDIHIGHVEAQYDAMDETIKYINQEAQPGDEIWGLGDWFHMYENGFDHCLKHPMTKKWRDLAQRIPTKLVPGNHDHELEKFRDNPNLGNPIDPIILIKPFEYKGFWYCHGHEYDPAVQYVPDWIMWAWNRLPHKMTPGNLKSKFVTEKYIMLVNLVHSRALLSIQKKTDKEGRNLKGIVLGHTHLPLHQESPDLPFLLNDGDMRHSSTYTIEDEKEFHQMHWSLSQKRWSVISLARP